jgi:glycosyltransferase involved in cell wall biosynthesis
LTVIPNGMRPPRSVFTERTLARFGLSHGRYVLSVGRLVPEKGFAELIAGFKKARAEAMRLREGGWKVVIVGRADHESSYSLRLKQIAARDANIILTGYLTGEQLAELYTHAGLFALASYYEGLPIVLLEALSYGCSCIVSDIPGNRNVPIEDYRFFPAGDIAAVSARIQEFALCPPTAEERGRQRWISLDWYDWDSVAARTLEVYRKALKAV